MIRYVLLLIFVGPWTIFLASLVILSRLITFSPRPGQILARFWNKGILWVTGVKVDIHGLEHVDKNGQYIIVSNHTSAFDIPVIMWGYPYSMVMLSKKALKYIPLFGWAMWTSGSIFVDRKNHSSALSTMNQTVEKLKKSKSSICIFPEGTRSLDGKVRSFKKGAFMLSLNSGIPILPAIIEGAFEAKSKHANKIKSGRISLTFYTPIDPQNYTIETRNNFLHDTRKLFLQKQEL